MMTILAVGATLLLSFFTIAIVTVVIKREEMEYGESHDEN